MRALIAVASVWAVIFAVPFVVYGAASVFLSLRQPDGPAWRFLLGVAVTKLGTAAAFVVLFAASREAWRGRRWLLYGAIWFLAFAASEAGDLVRGASNSAEAILGVLSEAVYAPVSAFAAHRLLSRKDPDLA